MGGRRVNTVAVTLSGWLTDGLIFGARRVGERGVSVVVDVPADLVVPFDYGQWIEDPKRAEVKCNVKALPVTSLIVHCCLAIDAGAHSASS